VSYPISDDFVRGAEAAADIADGYNGVTAHKYRLGDCILGKLNLRNGKPRRNRRLSYATLPDAELAALREIATVARRYRGDTEDDELALSIAAYDKVMSERR
jgi:hypothetical protein